MKLTPPAMRKRRPPEDSVELRAWVLAAVLVGEVAVLTSGYFDLVTGLLVPLLTAGRSWSATGEGARRTSS